MLAKQKQAQYRDNQIGIDFTTCPDQQCISIHNQPSAYTSLAKYFPQTTFPIHNCTAPLLSFISYKFTLPNGWKSQSPQQHEPQELTPHQLKQLNCLESITQTVSPVLIKDQDGVTINRFYFSFPLDLQLLAKTKVAEIQWPSLHFQVFQKDSWDRIYFQGCGFIQIPSHPGTFILQTQTWKPNLDYRTKVFQFFLGGLTRPKNIEIVSKSQDLTELDNKGPINRSLFDTISSGSIKTRLNIAIQSQAIKKQERTNFKVIKFSQQTEQIKSQYNKSQLPGQINTGNLLGGRFTTTKLNS